MTPRVRVVSAAAACCMLCLLCHHGASCSAQQLDHDHDHGLDGHNLEPIPPQHTPIGAKDEEPWPGHAQVLSVLLEQYGNGHTISKKGFQNLLRDLHLVQLSPGMKEKLVSTNDSSSRHKHEDEHQCQGVRVVLERTQPITADEVWRVCPALLVQLVAPSHCTHIHHDNVNNASESDPFTVWMYATVCIFLISGCGLLAVAMIPIMQGIFYQQLLQFLVALAVGTLCGDALLHLLPHAMSGGGGHSHHGEDKEEVHNKTNLWRGLVALMGIVFFFFTEKCLTLVGEWRRRNQRKKKIQVPAKVRVMRDSELQGSSSVGEKLCKHKYSPQPYCYSEITEGEREAAALAAEGALVESQPMPEVVPRKAEPEDLPEEEPLSQQAQENNAKDGGTVIVSEHGYSHHGHSHSHGHVHSAPDSLSSVAWMVVMGDGLHNFTDGLAIGAAFAASVPGGLSTATAVFCHELPHELGDFAVLLKAGMNVKQAVFYNVLSSVLCLLGMVLGMTLGHSQHATEWVFSLAAGMFLYIALVDMVPELASGHAGSTGSSAWFHMLLQLLGLLCGIGIMVLIALYEEDLHTLFCD